MSRWGLSEKQLSMMRETFSRFPEIREVRIFGSRAAGNYKPGSDVDLALYGDSKLSCTARVSAVLNEELPLPYFFDVVDYAAVERPEFRKHIEEVGQSIYRQGNLPAGEK